MRTSLFGLLFLAFGTFIPATLAGETPMPAIPNTANGTLSGQVVATTSATFPLAADAPKLRSRADMSPVRVVFPAIKLDSQIQNMGVLKNGELAVPSGNTKNVGWYAAGVLPGEMGSAVFDAHVFAAFSKLHSLNPGDDLYVVAADGTNLHFKVESTDLFRLGELSPSYLFSRADKKRLTLITCAGALTKDRSTYTHRLVVSAVLVE